MRSTVCWAHMTSASEGKAEGSRLGDLRQDTVPGKAKVVEVHGECDGIDQNGHGGQSSYNLCIHPFPVCCDASFAAALEVHAIQAGNCEGHDELEES